MGLFRKQAVLFKSLKAHPYHTAKMVREDRTAWKTNYFQRIEKLIEEYPTCFLVSADNVGSKQMQQIRIALRGRGEVLMGKNTMMRKALRGQLAKYPQLEKVLPTLLLLLLPLVIQLLPVYLIPSSMHSRMWLLYAWKLILTFHKLQQSRNTWQTQASSQQLLHLLKLHLQLLKKRKKRLRRTTQTNLDLMMTWDSVYLTNINLKRDIGNVCLFLVI